MSDRCDKCGLYNIQKTNICPKCGSIIDLKIENLCLSWKCRKCNFDVATTVEKLCFWDNGNFSKEYYTKSDVCPYFEENF